MKLSMVEVARITRGAILGDGGAVVTGVSIDSRTLASGDLFVAIPGEFFDGHDHVEEALRRGAGGLLLLREIGIDAPRVIVSEPVAALTSLAGHIRDEVDPIVIGITGSVGKTGTKDLVAAVASERFSTVASERNLNNELGLPLTLCRIRTETEVVVCEMGARGPGQIAQLCDLARPQVGIVTNVGVSHYALFGSQEAIADTKSELIACLDEGGTAVLNADDRWVAQMAERTQANVITFGISSPATVTAEAIRYDRLGRPTFRLSVGDQGAWVTLTQSGSHHVHNALAAAAAGHALGIDLSTIASGLEKARSSPWRMDVVDASGVIFVNDTYNASPTSMVSALQAAAEMAGSSGRLIAVLGYMAELGEIEDQEHRRVGALAASLAARLVVVGNAAQPMADGAVDAGMSDVIHVEGREDVLQHLDLQPGDVLLVKGSRVARLETVVEDAMKMVGAR